MLHPIALSVGDQVEVVLDGGVGRGSDVVKALALGARSVLIGRAYLRDLAANGQVSSTFPSTSTVYAPAVSVPAARTGG